MVSEAGDSRGAQDCRAPISVNPFGLNFAWGRPSKNKPTVPGEEPSTHEDNYLWLLAFAPDQVRSSPLWGPLAGDRRRTDYDFIPYLTVRSKGLICDIWPPLALCRVKDLPHFFRRIVRPSQTRPQLPEETRMP